MPRSSTAQAIAAIAILALAVFLVYPVVSKAIKVEADLPGFGVYTLSVELTGKNGETVPLAIYYKGQEVTGLRAVVEASLNVSGYSSVDYTCSLMAIGYIQDASGQWVQATSSPVSLNTSTGTVYSSSFDYFLCLGYHDSLNTILQKLSLPTPAYVTDVTYVKIRLWATMTVKPTGQTSPQVSTKSGSVDIILTITPDKWIKIQSVNVVASPY